MASTMKICSECQRHLLAPEPHCPFCGAAMPTAAAPSVLRRCQGVMLGLTIALGSVGCGPGVDDPPDAATTTSETGSTSQTTAVPGSTGTTMLLDPDTGGVSTGSDTTTVAESSSDDADDWGGGFYAGPDPDGGSNDFECDIFAQDCPEDEKCMPWANDGSNDWNATRCSPVDDTPAQPGEPCIVEGNSVSGIDDCDVGAMCWGVDPQTNEGECVAMCGNNEAAPTCDDAADGCFIANDGALVLCLPTCDPVLQDCADGEGCFPGGNDEGFFCLPPPDPPTTHGDSCDQLYDCSPGQQCVADFLFANCQGLGCCSTTCSTNDMGADAACDALESGQTCLPWFEPGQAPVGLEHVGVCGIDPA